MERHREKGREQDDGLKKQEKAERFVLSNKSCLSTTDACALMDGDGIQRKDILFGQMGG